MEADDFGPRWEVLERIGEGGMGVVYRARDREHGTLVALKTLRSADPQPLLRLKNEFRAVAELSHPNLVQLFDLFTAGERVFVTMELIEGVHLMEHLRDEGRGPPRDYDAVRDAFRQLVEGLSAIHAVARLHRDLKPSNVLVTRAGRVTILDFGLALEVSDELSRMSAERAAAGTAEYMAPEQAAAVQLSAASDLYAVGVMLFEALTGCVPFSGHALRVMMDKQTRDPPSPRRVVRGTPLDLEALCVDLLQRDPSQRPTIAEILERLGAEVPRTIAARPIEAPFVAREHELRALRAAFERVRDGAAVRVHVHGASGTGKSLLLRRFVEQIADEALVLSGRCYERVGAAVPRVRRHRRRALASPRGAARGGGRVGAAARGRRARALVPRPPARRRHRRGAAAHPRDPRSAGAPAARVPGVPRAVRANDRSHAGGADRRRHAVGRRRHGEPGARAAPRARSAGADVRRGVPRGGRRDQRRARRAARLVVRGRAPRPAGRTALGARGRGARRTHVAPRAARARADDRARVARASVLPPRARAARAGRRRRRSRDPPRRRPRARAAGAARGPAAPRGHLARGAHRGERRALGGGDRRAGRARARLGAPRQEPRARAPGARTRGARAVPRSHPRDGRGGARRPHAHGSPPSHRHRARGLGRRRSRGPAIHHRGAGDVERARRHAVRAADRAAEGLAFDTAAKLYAMAVELEQEPHTRRTLQWHLADALANAGRGAAAARAYFAAAEGAPSADALELRRCAAEQLLLSGRIDEGLVALDGVLGAVGMRLSRTPNRALMGMFVGKLRLGLRGYSWTERDATEVSPAELRKIDVCWSVVTGLGVVDNVRAREFAEKQALLALRAGERYRIARALACQVTSSAVEGSHAVERTARLTRLTHEVAERSAHPFARGFAELTAGLAAYLEGRFRDCLRTCESAGRVLRDECVGATWERGNANLFSLWALAQLGELRELQRRLPALTAEARARGDLYALVNLRSGRVNLAWLSADQPERARKEVEDARAEWPSRHVHLQHYYFLLARAQIDLYTRERDPLPDIEAAWVPLRRAFVFRIQTVHVEAAHLRARAMLARGDASLLSRVEKDAQAIEEESVAWAQGLADLLRAAVAHRRDQPDAAISALSTAVHRLERADMRAWSAVARARLAELRHDDEGHRAALEWLKSAGVVAPEKFVRLHAPGFE